MKQIIKPVIVIKNIYQIPNDIDETWYPPSWMIKFIDHIVYQGEPYIVFNSKAPSATKTDYVIRIMNDEIEKIVVLSKDSFDYCINQMNDSNNLYKIMRPKEVAIELIKSRIPEPTVSETEWIVPSGVNHPNEVEIPSWLTPYVYYLYIETDHQQRDGFVTIYLRLSHYSTIQVYSGDHIRRSMIKPLGKFNDDDIPSIQIYRKNSTEPAKPTVSEYRSTHIMDFQNTFEKLTTGDNTVVGINPSHPQYGLCAYILNPKFSENTCFLITVDENGLTYKADISIPDKFKSQATCSLDENNNNIFLVTPDEALDILQKYKNALIAKHDLESILIDKKSDLDCVGICIDSTAWNRSKIHQCVKEKQMNKRIINRIQNILKEGL